MPQPRSRPVSSFSLFSLHSPCSNHLELVKAPHEEQDPAFPAEAQEQPFQFRKKLEVAHLVRRRKLCVCSAWAGALSAWVRYPEAQEQLFVFREKVEVACLV